MQLQQALEQMVESRHQYEKEKREQEQQYEVRIISLEVEIQKQKDKQDSLGQEHVQKLKMLELALSDVQKLLDKKEQALAVEYQAELARIEDGINHRVTAKERENHELHHSIQ